MPYGPHFPKDRAYQIASGLILEAEPLAAAIASIVASDTNGEQLERLWTRARAHANDLANIRALVPGVIAYAKAMHPGTYDIDAKWAAAATAYAAIADEIEKLIVGAGGELQSRTLLGGAIQARNIPKAGLSRVAAAGRGLPNIRS